MNNNPHQLGTLEHGQWERQQKFEEMWRTYDHFDWHEFFAGFAMEEEFEQGVELTDDLMHQPINKDWVFELYWKAIFPEEKVNLIRQCHYYKGEEENPFPDWKQLWWYYEECWVKFNMEPNGRKHLKNDLKYYKSVGLGNISPNDGVPMSMKALLFNRWCHWSYDCDPEEFRKWYLELDYTNILG